MENKQRLRMEKGCFLGTVQAQETNGEIRFPPFLPLDFAEYHRHHSDTDIRHHPCSDIFPGIGLSFPLPRVSRLSFVETAVWQGLRIVNIQRGLYDFLEISLPNAGTRGENSFQRSCYYFLRLHLFLKGGGRGEILFSPHPPTPKQQMNLLTRGEEMLPAAAGCRGDTVRHATFTRLPDTCLSNMPSWCWREGT